jgi:hypothetical protein
VYYCYTDRSANSSSRQQGQGLQQDADAGAQGPRGKAAAGCTHSRQRKAAGEGRRGEGQQQRQCVLLQGGTDHADAGGRTEGQETAGTGTRGSRGSSSGRLQAAFAASGGGWQGAAAARG